MSYPSSLRLLGLQPWGPEAVLDADIRRAVRGPLRSVPGVSAVFAGRRQPEEGGERVIVSVWSSFEAMAEGLAEGRSDEPGELAYVPNAEVVTVRALPLAVALEFDPSATPTILRVFSGETRPGLLVDYIEQARAGTYADVMAAHGPIALYLGIDEPDHFLTVSLWTAWERIAAATGGNVRNPVATRHRQLLAGGTAVHYEILPNTAGQLEPVGIS